MNKNYDKSKTEETEKKRDEMNTSHGEAIGEDKKRTEKQEKDRQAEEQRQRERDREARKLRREREKILEERRKRDEGGDEGESDNEPTSPDSGPTEPTGGGGGNAKNGENTGGGFEKGGPTTIHADQVTIKTDKEPKIETSASKEAPTKTGPAILTPEPRGHVKFSEGPGWTPQQKKDVDERREAKYREKVEEDTMKRKTILGTAKTIRPEDIGAKGEVAISGEKESQARNLRDTAVSQARKGNVGEALKTANLIEDDEKQGYALWEIASVQAEKRDFGSAFGTISKIRNEKAKGLALNDINMMQERKIEE